MNKQISIIVPVYNEAATVEASLKCLAVYRQLGCEVIVVDGGSSDASLSLAKPYADIVLTANKGRARQMNVGANRASGSVLLFLHVDTRLPQKPEHILALLQRNSPWGYFSLSLSGKKPAFRVIETLINWRSKLSKVATGDQALFFNKHLFCQQKGYADIPLMEDIELCKRFRLLGKPYMMRESMHIEQALGEKRHYSYRYFNVALTFSFLVGSECL